MIFDALIVGGGAAGMQCALVLGSAKNKEFASNKTVGLIGHQKTSHLQNALFNNVLGLDPNSLGKDILESGKKQISDLYPHIIQINDEKVLLVEDYNDEYKISTNKNVYYSKIIVLALNYSKPFTINGLDKYLEPHSKTNSTKDRIQLKNKDHFVKKGLYVCGTLAGHRSQFAIAAGSGASVATDILTLWNNGSHVKIHDKV